MFRKLIIPTFIAILALKSSNADEIQMSNGSRLIGELIRIETDKVIFSTPFAGTITINQDNVERITTKDPVTLMMTNGTVYRERQIIATEQAMLMKSDDMASVVFDASDIEMVNPEPWELGEGYQWSGRFSDSDEWDLKASSVWLSLKDRYTLKGDIEFEESRGIETEDNWHLFSKYDRFLELGSKNYRGAKLSFEYDQFEDIDLRTVLGPHFGRQFSKTQRFKLEMELGPVWVNENYADGAKEDWVGALWFIDASTDIIGFGSTLYLDHDGILKVEEPGETILNAILGIRFPIAGGFETAFEIEYEYDGGAIEGIDKLDTTYNLRLGYSW